MRGLLIVGLKLWGISGLWRVFGIIPSIANVLYMSSNFPRGFNPLWVIVQLASSFCINVAYAYILLFRTEWVLTKLNVPDEPLQFSTSAFELLRVGLVIVGVMAMMGAISESGAVLLNLLFSSVQLKQTVGMANWGPAIKAVLEFVLGFVVIAKSRDIASRVFPGQR